MVRAFGELFFGKKLLLQFWVCVEVDQREAFFSDYHQIVQKVHFSQETFSLSGRVYQRQSSQALN